MPEPKTKESGFGTIDQTPPLMPVGQLALRRFIRFPHAVLSTPGENFQAPFRITVMCTKLLIYCHPDVADLRSIG